jgi:hypothetical protein
VQTQVDTMGDRTVVDVLDLSGGSFVVQSPLVGTRYAIRTAAGETLLEAKRLFFDEGLTYVYSDAAGERRVRSEDATEEGLDRFRFVAKESGQGLATLERSDEGSWYRWRLETAEGSEVLIEGESGSIPILDPQKGRHIAIRTPDGDPVGSADRRLLSLRFTFDVEIDGVGQDLKAGVLLAIPLLYDAMQKGHSTWER